MREKVSLELKVEALGLLKTGLSVSSVSKQLKIPSIKAYSNPADLLRKLGK